MFCLRFLDHQFQIAVFHKTHIPYGFYKVIFLWITIKKLFYDIRIWKIQQQNISTQNFGHFRTEVKFSVPKKNFKKTFKKS